MLKLKPNPTFWVKLKTRVPGGEEVEFEIEFRHKGREAVKSFLESSTDRNEAEVMAEVIAGWRGLDVDFSADHLKTLLDNYPGLGSLLLAEYIGELTKARAGN